MRAFRLAIASLLLDLLRIVYPASTKQPKWQIIEVPRRITETEAADLAAQIENL